MPSYDESVGPRAHPLMTLRRADRGLAQSGEGLEGGGAGGSGAGDSDSAEPPVPPSGGAVPFLEPPSGVRYPYYYGDDHSGKAAQDLKKGRTAGGIFTFVRNGELNAVPIKSEAEAEENRRRAGRYEEAVRKLPFGEVIQIDDDDDAAAEAPGHLKGRLGRNEHFPKLCAESGTETTTMGVNASIRISEPFSYWNPWAHGEYGKAHELRKEANRLGWLRIHKCRGDAAAQTILNKFSRLRRKEAEEYMQGVGRTPETVGAAFRSRVEKDPELGKHHMFIEDAKVASSPRLWRPDLMTESKNGLVLFIVDLDGLYFTMRDEEERALKESPREDDIARDAHAEWGRKHVAIVYVRAYLDGAGFSADRFADEMLEIMKMGIGELKEALAHSDPELRLAEASSGLYTVLRMFAKGNVVGGGIFSPALLHQPRRRPQVLEGRCSNPDCPTPESSSGRWAYGRKGWPSEGQIFCRACYLYTNKHKGEKMRPRLGLALAHEGEGEGEGDG
eukprot:tig00021238_g19551.t1